MTDLFTTPVKYEMSSRMIKLWRQVEKTGLWTEKSNIDFESFNAMVANDKEELEALLSIQCDSVEIEKMEIDQLIHMPFDQAKRNIFSMTMKNRLRLLGDLQKKLEFYYDGASRYCGVSKDLLITAAEFRSLIGKIKHLEILQNWFYGIE